MSRIHSMLYLLLLAVCFFQPLTVQADTAAVDSRQNSSWDHFDNLVNTIKAVEEELRLSRQELNKSQYDEERQRAQANVEQLNQELTSLKIAWEMWATGGVDLQLFQSSGKEEKFDWKNELESVFEPILVELRRLTERPRKIERLRSVQHYYQLRLQAVDSALSNIGEYKSKAPSTDLVNAFGDLEKRWQKRRDDLSSRLDLATFELEELLNPGNDAENKSIETLKQLFTGRLLNLLLALLAAALVYGLILVGNNLYARHLLRRGRSPALLTRLLHLFLVMLGSVLALLAAMSVLYARGDWILLGMMIIVLVGLVLVLQRYLPGYLTEAKLLLNIGQVREGERVIYQGLPWRVNALRVYSTLVNPLLTGGSLRLPLTELTTLISRPYTQQEPWFPSRENDFVVLNDDTFGRVIFQSPETVQMRVAGAIKSFPTASFIDQCPKNLSLDGFAVLLRFGIDYAHQAEVTSNIRATLENYLRERLAEQPYAINIEKVTLEFAQAGASSLDFLGIVSCNSAMAESYLQLNRLLQCIAVDACNQFGWVIPFNQMTVHLAGADGAKS